MVRGLELRRHQPPGEGPICGVAFEKSAASERGLEGGSGPVRAHGRALVFSACVARKFVAGLARSPPSTREGCFCSVTASTVCTMESRSVLAHAVSSI